MVRAKEVVIAWDARFSDSVYYIAIVELQNLGTAWAKISAGDSDYTVLDQDGGVVTTGTFLYEYPKFIGPGETGFLIWDSIEDGYKVKDFASIETTGRYEEVDGPDVTFEVSDIVWKRSQLSDGLIATGFVTADKDVEDAALAVVCLDADGKVLGATTTNLLQNLSAGKRKGFKTVTETGPLGPGACQQSVGYAEDTGF